MYLCQRKESITGRPCNKTFAKTWNLKKHMENQHQTPTITANQDTTIASILDSQKLSTIISTQLAHQVGQEALVQALTSALVQLRSAGSDQQNARPHKIQQQSIDDAPSLHQQSPVALSPASSESSIPTLMDGTELAGLPPCEDVDLYDSAHTRKRKLSTIAYDRIAFAMKAPPLPVYDLKMSVQIPDQLRAIAWLTKDGHDSFYLRHEYWLAIWGASLSHDGTCVILPEDWKSADPMDLLTLFDLDNCPVGGSTRLRYQYGDHNTSHARSLGWFDKNQWPRSAEALANFLSLGPFKPMDASHTCHHDCCIIHVTWEDAATNQDRKYCHRLAKRLRREGKCPPKHCNRHNPPCLLQLAALETNEAFSIQFNVLRLARGLSISPDPIPRPRRHPFSTFEGKLPCIFPDIVVDEARLIKERPTSIRPDGKPSLLCIFCKKIKTFDSITGFWGHLVHKHDGIDTSVRLKAIYRTAVKWNEYWKKYSKGGKAGNVTKSRIEQVLKGGLTWDDVLEWKLR